MQYCGICWAGKNGVRMHYCDQASGHGTNHRCHCGETLTGPVKLMGPPDAVVRREALVTVLTGSWHALKSYENGNTAPGLAAEMAKAVEQAAKILDVAIEGIE